MELDELQKRWAGQDRRLDEVLRLNRKLLLANDLGRVRSTMQRLRAMLGIELVIGVAGLVALGSFIVNHITELRFVAPAGVLYLTVLGTCIATILQWVKAGTIDYAAPVTEIQRRLESLRVSVIRSTLVLLLLGPLLWTPFLIVALRAALGADAYVLLGAKYLIVNLVFGLVFAAAMVWVSRRFADRLDRSPWAQGLARVLAGTSITAALEQLARIAAFEREEGSA